MSIEITPSKQVRRKTRPIVTSIGVPIRAIPANTMAIQAASAIESFKMESPIKKLDFGSADKENQPGSPNDKSTSEEAVAPLETKITKPTEVESKVEVAKTPEMDEPLLRENPQRFVMFPIKYHEVSPIPINGHP